MSEFSSKTVGPPGLVIAFLDLVWCLWLARWARVMTKQNQEA